MQDIPSEGVTSGEYQKPQCYVNMAGEDGNLYFLLCATISALWQAGHKQQAVIAMVTTTNKGFNYQEAVDYLQSFVTFVDPDQNAIEAVTQFVYNRCADLRPDNVIGFSREDLERVKVENGHLVFTVEDVHIHSKEVENGTITYYIAATMYFAVDQGEEIEGSTDIYQAYKDDQGAWCIEWYAE